MTNTYYFDMDGVIANFHKAYATNKGTALSHKAMADLEPFTEAVNLVKALIKGGSTVYINSLAANENGKAGKLEWLAKYLPEIDKDHKLLIAVQPTRGLDVGAIEGVHKNLIKERDNGRAVLLISLELEEVMNVPDRILVMYEGEIVGELDPKKTTVEELGLFMAGAKRNVGFDANTPEIEKSETVDAVRKEEA